MPRKDVLIHAIDKCAVQVEQEGWPTESLVQRILSPVPRTLLLIGWHRRPCGKLRESLLRLLVTIAANVQEGVSLAGKESAGVASNSVQKLFGDRVLSHALRPCAFKLGS